MNSKAPIIVNGSHSRESIDNDPHGPYNLRPPQTYRNHSFSRQETGLIFPVTHTITNSANIWLSRHPSDYATYQPNHYPWVQSPVQALLPSNYAPPVSNSSSNYQIYNTSQAHNRLVRPNLGKPLQTEAKPNRYSRLPRGPPRKPRQSGHAIWVGNLPFNTSIIDLRDHFSKGFTRDIESVFLMLKSNCAFINYSTETACQEATDIFQNSQFMGVSLVCRTRKPKFSTDVVDEHNNPKEEQSNPEEERNNPEEEQNNPEEEQNNSEEDIRTQCSSSLSGETAFLKESFGTAILEDEKTPEIKQRSQELDRFFVLKSLSVDDLYRSVRYGIWTAQNHNEELLNQAYYSSNNVFLIFSANKSSGYFGYGRMISPVTSTNASILSTLNTEKNLRDSPKTIQTHASEFAPPGHVFEDPVRGTLFWESNSINDTDSLEDDRKTYDEIEVERRFGGRPYKVAWISTTRVPFSRTRGLRNIWNGNKDVKVARDGTELEPIVGRELIRLFHQ